MITVTGLDVESFDKLLDLFQPYFDRYTPHNRDGNIVLKRRREKRGRKRLIDACTCLALSLYYLRTKGSMFSCQAFFGLTATPLSIWLRFSKRILILVLGNKEDIKVKMPSDEEVNELAAVIRYHYPSLDEHFCVGDGLKLSIEAPDDDLIQSQFYNGWTHGHYVTNLFFFAPDGMIICAVINAAGSLHDSTLAEMGPYQKLQEVFERTGKKCVMDSAFAAGSHDFILKSSQMYGKDTCIVQDLAEHRKLTDATSVRQAAEWGMRARQGSFPRITDKFPYEDGRGERHETLKLVVLIYNFRCKYVGLNHLRNSFVPNWSKDAKYLVC